ncbi:MAG: DUF4412 domain-containing protein [Bacteroidales bacterium]|nr:DUF4412 domain-containing protein [Bacteroidales bacterium]
MQKYINFLVIIISVSILLLNCNCNTIDNFSKIKEGKIIYSIEYPKEEEQSSLVTLLPETMELKFKEDNTVINIKGFFAIFSLIYVSNHETHTNYSLLKIMNQKKMYKADTVDAPFGYEKMKDIEIEYTNDTLTICGFLCKKALAHSKTSKDNVYELYYTNEIGIKNPNTNNPFKQLNGVLLGFQVRLCGIRMNMKAIEISPEPVEDSAFNIPEGYDNLSREELEDFINSFTK